MITSASLQSGIAKVFVWWAVFRYTEFFAGPSAQIHTFASGAAKRAVRVGAAVQAQARTAGATDLAGLDGCGLVRVTHAHKDISKGTSSALATSRPSLCCCIIRITTSKRLQLISGVMFSVGSIFRRSSWKVRP